LPRLVAKLSNEKPAESVKASKQLAEQRQDKTLLSWLDGQSLPQRAERLARLQHDAEELVTARIGVAVLEGVIPNLLEDPASRLAMTDDILRARVARWPLVNLVHTLFTPLMSVWRANLSPAGSLTLQNADSLVDAYLNQSGRPISQTIQAAFAQLRQSQPAVAELYRDNKLWEDMPADLAGSELRRRLSATVERQRTEARKKLVGKTAVIGAPVRWLLTIGAVLWFPLVQPLLHAFLTAGIVSTPRELAAMVVGILSGEALLKSVSFLALWFLVIWLALRWNTQRRVARLLAKWRGADYPDRSLNLTTAALEWMAELVEPIRRSRERMDSVIRRAAQFPKSPS
jgi:hypothetical protein